MSRPVLRPLGRDDLLGRLWRVLLELRGGSLLPPEVLPGWGEGLSLPQLRASMIGPR
jgi:hypothetical protein